MLRFTVIRLSLYSDVSLIDNFQALLVSYAKVNNFYLLLIQMIESGPKIPILARIVRFFLVL